jgi:hypothetical protein
MKDNPNYSMYRFLLILTAASALGLEGWRNLFNNFAVEKAFLDGKDIGLIQSFREVPGFLALLVVYVLMIIKEHRLTAISILTMGIGIAMTGFFPSFAGIMITTVIMSFGFHYFETTNQSLALQYFDKKTSPWIFGKLRSYGAAANIASGLFILSVGSFLSYTQMFFILGFILVGAAIYCLCQDPTNKELVPQHKKMVFKKKYWLYYLLTFLAGARRQIFVAFAVFLLVKQFNYTITSVTILFVINNSVNFFLSPAVGKAIIAFGEKRILTIEYIANIVIFIAYATTQSVIFVGALYILDSIFFNFAIGVRTYFQKVADSKDIAPSMAVGFTINHIAAVVIPAMGGILWMFDYRIPFFFGAGLSLIALIFAQYIKIEPEVEPT